MPNSCDILITRGKNKGKSCRDVNRVCRHQMISCKNCGTDFSYRHTYVAHVCPNMEDSCDSTAINTNSVNSINTNNRTKSTNDRKKLTPRAKASTKGKGTKFSQLEQRLQELEQQNKHLESRVSEAEKRPQNIQNIVVIGNDFYSELVDKFGKNLAINYLTNAAVSSKPIDVIEKLYLDGKDPMCYPIACRNEDHFRYLDSESKIVDDCGGSGIGNLMTDRLQNAMLMAINEISNAAINNETNASANQEQLSNIVNAQRSVTHGFDKAALINQLAIMTHNEKHPFFEK